MSTDAKIFITRDALANQILEFGVPNGNEEAYARDLAEHIMSEFLVMEDEDPEVLDASVCGHCGGTEFHHTVECAWANAEKGSN